MSIIADTNIYPGLGVSTEKLNEYVVMYSYTTFALHKYLGIFEDAPVEKELAIGQVPLVKTSINQCGNRLN